MAVIISEASRITGVKVSCPKRTAATVCYLRRFSQPSTPRHSKPEHRHFKAVLPIVQPEKRGKASSVLEKVENHRDASDVSVAHHVSLLCASLDKSLEFYQGLLGLTINPDRPDSKLPYRGAWLWIGPEMIHLMELPNPDPAEGSAQHGGMDRHVCVGIENLAPLIEKLDAAGITCTKSQSGRPGVSFRDPDMNYLEVVATAP